MSFDTWKQDHADVRPWITTDSDTEHIDTTDAVIDCLGYHIGVAYQALQKSRDGFLSADALVVRGAIEDLQDLFDEYVTDTREQP